MTKSPLDWIQNEISRQNPEALLVENLQEFQLLPLYASTPSKRKILLVCGQNGPFQQFSLPIKDSWLKPLQKNWRKTLNT